MKRKPQRLCSFWGFVVFESTEGKRVAKGIIDLRKFNSRTEDHASRGRMFAFLLISRASSIDVFGFLNRKDDIDFFTKKIIKKETRIRTRKRNNKKARLLKSRFSTFYFTIELYF